MPLEHKDYIAMCERIPAETLKFELLKYLETQGDVAEVREVLQSFLQFYVTKR